MATVHIDPTFDDLERRQRLFRGDIVIYTHVPEVLAYGEFIREMVTEVFAPHAPTTVHEHRSPEDLADLLVTFKPRLIHDPRSLEHVRRVLVALGAVAERTYADVPKLRTAFPQGGLSTGIAYAFQAHRDTWYGAPAQQVNWWMPVWPGTEKNIMRFFPRRFGRAIENNSGAYNYYEANVWRSRMKDFSGATDTRVHPAPGHQLDESEPDLCLVPPVGGIMLFSGDHLHETIPNTSGLTRYSVDFRTVDRDDVRSGAGAPRCDADCQGTSLRDFHRLTDDAALDESDIAPYDTEGAEGLKVFVPS